MNLKLHRLVRTPYSEQYALFDLDQTDENYDPMSLGKLDLHFTPQAVYGTFLMWTAATAKLPSDQVRELVIATLQEICEPMGIPAFYAVEYLAPDLGTYQLFTNEDNQHDSRNDAGS
jgi:hypothetical protein